MSDDMPPLRRRVAPLAVLFLLAPWVAEYLLGNVPGTWLWALPVLAPMYGGGAILVREIAIRAQAGWPSILLLGLAYGLIEAGLVDQSLFNPGYGDLGFQEVTPIPALGISALNATTFLSGHAVWSIGLPIAFTQFLFPREARAPWLGPISWPIVALLYLFGCWIIFADVRQAEDFLASPAQRAGTAMAALACVALAIGSRHLTGGSVLTPPRPSLTGIMGFALSSAAVLVPETWTGFALKLMVLVAWAWLALRMTCHLTWSIRHSIAFAGGILMTYAWLGPVLTTLIHGGGAMLYAWNAVFALCALIMVVLPWRRCRHMPGSQLGSTSRPR